MRPNLRTLSVNIRLYIDSLELFIEQDARHGEHWGYGMNKANKVAALIKYILVKKSTQHIINNTKWINKKRGDYKHNSKNDRVGVVTLEGQESVLVKVAFELRAKWRENRSLENVWGETIFQAAGTACANVLGASVRTQHLEEMKEEGQNKMRKRKKRDERQGVRWWKLEVLIQSYALESPRGALQNTPHSGPIPKDSNIIGLGRGRGAIICFNLSKWFYRTPRWEPVV